MVKITYAPWQEIIIHETIAHSFEELIKIRSVGVQTGGLARPLMWAEGIVFDRGVMPPSPEMIKENLEGRLHFLFTEWAPLPQYQSLHEIQETKVKIPIINVSSNAVLSEVAKWLKQSTKFSKPSSRIS